MNQNLQNLLSQLKSKEISKEDRALILNTLLDSVQALPLKDLITFDVQGTLKVNGRELDPEQMIQLREGAVALEKNFAYRLIKDQTLYEAIKMGVHLSLSLDMVLMSKAAIWVMQNEDKLIKQLTE